MQLRKLVLSSLGATILLAPAAARAQEGEADSGLDRLASRLADPRAQLAASAALVAMSEALLQMRVEPFANAARQAGAGRSLPPLPRDARLRDLAGPRADRLQAEIAREAPQAMGRAAAMVEAIQGMMPELKAMARRMKQALPPE